MNIKLFICMSLLFASSTYADQTVWQGEIKSNGVPSELVKLELKEKYKIKVSGFMNLGKWIQNREKLANDACYEFSPEKEIVKLEALKNSFDVSVCDGSYHADHVYQSEPFTAMQNRIHFWVYDTDYDDNIGSFQVEVIQLKD